MREAVLTACKKAAVLIMAAAVSDFRIAHPAANMPLEEKGPNGSAKWLKKGLLPCILKKNFVKNVWIAARSAPWAPSCSETRKWSSIMRPAWNAGSAGGSIICPEGAIKQVDPIPYPRIIRAIFSDPTIRHESTGVSGRGTEEMKTNDVTNNFVEGKIGFSIELGRPGVGAYLDRSGKGRQGN